MVDKFVVRQPAILAGQTRFLCLVHPVLFTMDLRCDEVEWAVHFVNTHKNMFKRKRKINDEEREKEKE